MTSVDVDFGQLGQDVLVSLTLAIGFAAGIIGAVQMNSYFASPNDTPISILIAGVSLIILGVAIVGGIASEVF
jgi:hypothetical protein